MRRKKSKILMREWWLELFNFKIEKTDKGKRLKERFEQEKFDEEEARKKRKRLHLC